jgi:DNA-binding IclR family transcriptional regulator
MICDGQDQGAELPTPSKAAQDAELVTRALDIFELLASSDRGLLAKEVCMRLNLPLDKGQALLSTLTRRGFLNCDVHTKHYAIGNKLLELAGMGAGGVRGKR